MEYCNKALYKSCQEKYMKKVGINQFYNTKYDAKNPEFWKSIGLPNGPDKEYVCIGVKASNYFMPKETLSEKGPGGGGWILMAGSSDFRRSIFIILVSVLFSLRKHLFDLEQNQTFPVTT